MNKTNRQPSEWEEMPGNEATQQGINFQSIQVAHAAQYKKETDNPSKLGRRSK